MEFSTEFIMQVGQMLAQELGRRYGQQASIYV